MPSNENKKLYIYKNGRYVIPSVEPDWDQTPKHQVTTTIVVNATTNINGRVFQNYTANLITIPGSYIYYQILKNGEPLTEDDCKEYMKYMTGSEFIPRYNYDFPSNTYFIFADTSIWKPQYDTTNGLRLYEMMDKQEPGTKLYKHTIEISLGTKVIIISGRRLSYGTNISLMDMFMLGLLLDDEFVSCNYPDASAIYPAFPYRDFTFKYIKGDGTIGTLTTEENVSDIVTEL